MAEPKPGWRRVKFGDVVRLVKQTCKTPSSEGIERYIGLEHLESGDMRVRTWGDVADGTTFATRVRPGQVLFGKRRAYQRKVAVADFDAVCSGDIYVFESADPCALLPELLPFICQTEPFFEYAVGTSAGSLSPRTNWLSLARYEFVLPPLEEQKRMAHALEAAREAAEGARTAEERARTVARAQVENQLALLRQQQPLVIAASLIDRLTVGIVVKPADLYTDDPSGVPALRSLNVSPGRLVLSDLVRITREGHEVHGKSQLREGDVVVVRTGRPGEAAAIPKGVGPLNCIDLIVTTPGAMLHPDYFVLVLNSASGKRLFSAGATGTAQQHFNVGAFKRLAIPVPPRSVQCEMVEAAASIGRAAEGLALRASASRLILETILNRLAC